MDCCRYCARFEANPTDRRRAGRCTLTDTRTAPGGTCAAYTDPVAEVVQDMLDLLDCLRAAPDPRRRPPAARRAAGRRLAAEPLDESEPAPADYRFEP